MTIDGNENDEQNRYRDKRMAIMVMRVNENDDVDYDGNELEDWKSMIVREKDMEMNIYMRLS